MNKEDSKLSPSTIDEVILAKAVPLNEQGVSTASSTEREELSTEIDKETPALEQAHTITGTEETVKDLKRKKLPIPGLIETDTNPLAYPLAESDKAAVVLEPEVLLSAVLFKIFFCIFGVLLAISLLKKQIIEYLVNNQLIVLNGNLYTSAHVTFSTNLPEYLLYFTLCLLPIFLLITFIATAVDYVSTRKVHIILRCILLLVVLGILGGLSVYFFSSNEIDVIDFIRSKVVLLSIVFEFH